MYEIVIHGWANSHPKSVIRECKQCDILAESLGDFVNEHMFQSFWIEYSDGNITVGRNESNNPFMEYTYSSPLDVNYVGLSTGFGSCGIFKFCKLESKTVIVMLNEVNNVTCSRQYIIRVTFAHYGREHHEYNCDVIYQNMDCYNVTEFVAGECNNKTSCVFQPSNLKEPCSQTYNYWEILYECIVDTENPTITCPLNAIVDTDEGVDTALVDYSQNISATDNSEDYISINPNPELKFPSNLTIGENHFNFTARDTSGNSDTCTFTVKVQDTENPKLICPSNTTVGTHEGVDIALVDYSQNITATDNIQDDDLIILPEVKSVFPVNLTTGKNHFNFTVTDSSGNTDKCAFTVKVQDPTTEHQKTEPVKVENIVEDIKNFENDVLSQVKNNRLSGEVLHKEQNFVALVKIESANVKFINSSVELSEEDSQVDFNLQLKNNTSGDIVMIATFNNALNESNVINGNEITELGYSEDVEYWYLAELFSCSIFDIATLKLIDAELTFKVSTKNDMFGNEAQKTKEKICVFYNETQRFWSDKGVRRIAQSHTEVTCHSDHLTSFTVLMKVTKTEVSQAHAVNLSLMSKVCVSLSLVALCVCLIIYCSFSELWKSLRNSIHKNLVANMILMQFLFIIGIDKTKKKVACEVVKILLHLTSLNSFSWMCGEAVYLLFQVSTTAPAHFNKLRNYLLLCYGGPLFIILISSAGYGYRVETEHCWLGHEEGMIWAFAAPAICIIMVNTAIMFKVVKVIYDRAGNMVGTSVAEKTKFEQMRKAAKGMAILLPLMGTTWLIGPFVVSPDAVFMEYIFVLLNGCQGVFIFLIYCVYDHEVRECFRKRYKTQQVTPNTEMT